MDDDYPEKEFDAAEEHIDPYIHSYGAEYVVDPWGFHSGRDVHNCNFVIVLVGVPAAELADGGIGMMSFHYFDRRYK